MQKVLQKDTSESRILQFAIEIYAVLSGFHQANTSRGVETFYKGQFKSLRFGAERLKIGTKVTHDDIKNFNEKIPMPLFSHLKDNILSRFALYIS